MRDRVQAEDGEVRQNGEEKSAESVARGGKKARASVGAAAQGAAQSKTCGGLFTGAAVPDPACRAGNAPPPAQSVAAKRNSTTESAGVAPAGACPPKGILPGAGPPEAALSGVSLSNVFLRNAAPPGASPPQGIQIDQKPHGGQACKTKTIPRGEAAAGACGRSLRAGNKAGAGAATLRKQPPADALYDLALDAAVIAQSVAAQYGVLPGAQAELPWAEWCLLVSGLLPDTPLGLTVAARAEHDPAALARQTPWQRSERRRWMDFCAAQKTGITPDSAGSDASAQQRRAMQGLEKAMERMFG